MLSRGALCSVVRPAEGTQGMGTIPAPSTLQVAARTAPQGGECAGKLGAGGGVLDEMPSPPPSFPARLRFPRVGGPAVIALHGEVQEHRAISQVLFGDGGPVGFDEVGTESVGGRFGREHPGSCRFLGTSRLRETPSLPCPGHSPPPGHRSHPFCNIRSPSHLLGRITFPIDR